MTAAQNRYLHVLIRKLAVSKREVLTLANMDAWPTTKADATAQINHLLRCIHEGRGLASAQQSKEK